VNDKDGMRGDPLKKKTCADSRRQATAGEGGGRQCSAGSRIKQKRDCKGTAYVKENDAKRVNA